MRCPTVDPLHLVLPVCENVKKAYKFLVGRGKEGKLTFHKFCTFMGIKSSLTDQECPPNHRNGIILKAAILGIALSGEI